MQVSASWDDLSQSLDFWEILLDLGILRAGLDVAAELKDGIIPRSVQEREFLSWI